MASENSKTLSKNSVEKALKLFTEIEKKRKRRKRTEDEDDAANKYSLYCNPVISNSSKKKSVAQAFSPNFALNEMRLCLMKHDWVNLQRLFPLILQLSSFKETLVWRYALTILLHSPSSSEASLKEFFNMCVGCQDDNFKKTVAELISLECIEKSKQVNQAEPLRKNIKN